MEHLAKDMFLIDLSWDEFQDNESSYPDKTGKEFQHEDSTSLAPGRSTGRQWKSMIVWWCGGGRGLLISLKPFVLQVFLLGQHDYEV